MFENSQVLNYMSNNYVQNVIYNKKVAKDYSNQRHKNLKELFKSYGIDINYIYDRDALVCLSVSIIVKQESRIGKMPTMAAIIENYKKECSYKYSENRDSCQKHISLEQYICEKYPNVLKKAKALFTKYYVKGYLKILKTPLLNISGYANNGDIYSYYCNKFGDMRILENIFAYLIAFNKNPNIIYSILGHGDEINWLVKEFEEILANFDKIKNPLFSTKEEFIECINDMKECIKLYANFKQEYKKAAAELEWSEVRKRFLSKYAKETHYNKDGHMKLTSNLLKDGRFGEWGEDD